MFIPRSHNASSRPVKERLVVRMRLRDTFRSQRREIEQDSKQLSILEIKKGKESYCRGQSHGRAPELDVMTTR